MGRIISLRDGFFALCYSSFANDRFVLSTLYCGNVQQFPLYCAKVLLFITIFTYITAQYRKNAYFKEYFVYPLTLCFFGGSIKEGYNGKVFISDMKTLSFAVILS